MLSSAENERYLDFMRAERIGGLAYMIEEEHHYDW